MVGSAEQPGHKDRGGLLRFLGGLMVLSGIGMAFAGPAEMYCFYLFSEGGPLHFEGFGFGSFMFANIAIQIAGYYAIAAIGLALGYGHLKLKRWAHPLTVTMIVVWLVIGLPLTLIALMIFIQSKDPSLLTFLIAAPVAAAIYPAAPLLLLRLYRGRDVTGTFASADPNPSHLESIPLRVRVLIGLLLFCIVALHGPILFRGLYPFFGTLLVDLTGILALDLTMLALGGLAWGLASLKPWAWWGTVIGFAGLGLSFACTFARHTVQDVLSLMRFAPVEMDALSNLPYLHQRPWLAALPSGQ